MGVEVSILRTESVVRENESVGTTGKWLSLRAMRLERLELFAIEAAPAVGAVGGSVIAANCRYAFLRVGMGDYAGWGTCLIAEENGQFDIISWASFLHRIKPLTLEEAFLEAERQRDVWGCCKTDLALEALRQLESQARAGLASSAADAAAVMRRATAYYDVLF